MQISDRDATTLTKFRSLLLEHDLTQTLFDEINAHLAEQGLLMRADAQLSHRGRGQKLGLMEAASPKLAQFSVGAIIDSRADVVPGR